MIKHALFLISLSEHQLTVVTSSKKFYMIVTINRFQGCTATVLLVWIDHNEEVFAQCANVGDSACVIKYVYSFHNTSPTKK